MDLNKNAKLILNLQKDGGLFCKNYKFQKNDYYKIGAYFLCFRAEYLVLRIQNLYYLLEYIKKLLKYNVKYNKFDNIYIGRFYLINIPFN